MLLISLCTKVIVSILNISILKQIDSLNLNTSYFRIEYYKIRKINNMCMNVFILIIVRRAINKMF